MFNTFRQASSFNGDGTNWDVSKVTTMFGMFYDAFSFNQNLNSWNVASVKQRIEYLYSLSPVLLARDREYFLSTEIEELLELSTRSLQDWLVTFEEAILLAAHEAEREVQDTHGTITSYFNRTQ